MYVDSVTGNAQKTFGLMIFENRATKFFLTNVSAILVRSHIILFNIK